jgi:ethanolamine utilization protein EutA (predicted chaperonin)
MDKLPDHNLLCAQYAESAGALEESGKDGATICSITLGSLHTHVAVCRAGATIDSACLDLGYDCIRLDGDGKVSYLSDGGETFLNAVAKNIRLSDTVTEEQLALLAELVAETIVNLVCRRRPPQVSQRLLCTEPLSQFHAISEYWLSGLPTEDSMGHQATTGSNLGAPLAQGLVCALAERGLKYKIVAST